MIDFTRIDYVKDGNGKQMRAFEVLTRYKVLEKLKPYSSVLSVTVPIKMILKAVS